MSLIIAIDDATAGDIDVTITSSPAFDTVRIAAIDAAVGNEIDTASGAVGILGVLSLTGIPQDRVIHITAVGLDAGGLVTATGNAIVLNSFSWGDLTSSYVLSNVRGEASEYRLKVSGTVVGTSTSNHIQDATVYADEDTAKAIRYTVSAVVNGNESNVELLSLSRHNLPTCFVQSRFLDVLGDVRPGARIEFTPQSPRAKDRFQVVKPAIHRGVIFHRQAAITLSADPEGLIGLYLPWDLVVNVKAIEYGLNADFVVPRQANAELSDLTLVHRSTGPSNA